MMEVRELDKYSMNDSDEKTYGTCTSDSQAGSLSSNVSSGNIGSTTSTPWLVIWERLSQCVRKNHDGDLTGLIESEPNGKRTLTSLTGVFAPVALSMFGTFLFMRIA